MASVFHYVHPDKPAQLFVNEVGVAASHQSQGIGLRLLTALLEHGRRIGCTEAWVATEQNNIAARALYRRAGWYRKPRFDSHVCVQAQRRSMKMINVRQAGVGDIDALVPLFDAYRQFYMRGTDQARAREFLFQRFQHQQSVIFIAHDDQGVAIGFTQLYPLFSSLTLARTFVLYDLFVVPSARRSGAARQLLRSAADYGRAVGAGALELSTATDNEAAQRLYESEGWVRDTAFYVYGLAL